jgi:hypothetical protein
MKTFIDFLIQSSEWFALVSGIFGALLFIVMLLSLDGLKRMGEIFNTSYSVKKIENAVNAKADIENALFSRAKMLGFFVSIASIWIFIFLIFQLDVEKVLGILSVRQNLQPFYLALLQTAKLFSILSIVFSFLFGLILIFDRNSAEKISSFFSNWYSTENIEKKLDETILKDTDTICFLHNKFVGLLGFLASVILLGFSVINMLKK